MNRLLKLSAAALSTLFLASGANALSNTDIACPQADCNTVNICLSDDCTPSDCPDIRSLATQCDSNTDLLKALIENGSCNTDDLKCLISDGTCTAEEVCTALESCDTDCADVEAMLEDVSCLNAEDCVNAADNCSSDINLIKSLLEDCTECDTAVKGVTDCGDVQTVIKVVPGDCDKAATEETAEDDCTDCDNTDTDCTNGDCDVNDTCEGGSCNNDYQTILDKYGVDVNDCIVNGNCGNGKYQTIYGSFDKFEDILKALGLNSQQSSDTEDNSDTPNTPVSEDKTDTSGKPVTEDNSDTATNPTNENTTSKPVTSNTDTTSKPTNTNTSDSNVSEYEKRVVELVNIERAKYGLSPLTLNAELSRVARLKSQDMRDKNYFSHTSPTYGSPFDMMKQFGISYRTAGENIARGQRTPEEVVNGWMNSEGHRANILNSSFKEIGVGYVADGNYWTQMFIG